jgi:hypothetical protein
MIFGFALLSELRVKLRVNVGARPDLRLDIPLILNVSNPLILVVVPFKIHLLLHQLVVIEVVQFLPLVSLVLLLVFESSSVADLPRDDIVLAWAWVSLGRFLRSTVVVLRALWLLRQGASLGSFGGSPVYNGGCFLQLGKVRVVSAWAKSRILANLVLLLDEGLLLLNELLLKDLCLAVNVDLLLLFLEIIGILKHGRE